LIAAHAAVKAHSVGRYVNYAEPDTPPSRYFGANLKRLVAVRQKYDPSGLMYSGV
jgi:FAD/FMN-containing dehydrogenase